MSYEPIRYMLHVPHVQTFQGEGGVCRSRNLIYAEAVALNCVVANAVADFMLTLPEKAPENSREMLADTIRKALARWHNGPREGILETFIADAILEARA